MMNWLKIVGFFSLVFVVLCGDVSGSDTEDVGAANTRHTTSVVLYTEDEFQENAIQKAHFIMFYAPWCGHCQRLKPIWEELAKQMDEEDDLDVTIAKVDCTTETKLCSDEGVLGYPTLKFYHPERESIRYKGARDLEKLKEFVKITLTWEPVEETTATSNNGLYELTNDNFEDQIAYSKHFIKFFAPWCGHCKKLEPTWQQLAKLYEPTDDAALVKIGRVDCTKHRDVCSKYKVRGYPTLLWFENGQMVQQYQQGRDLESLKNFVKKMTNTEGDESEAEESDDDTLPSVQVQDGVYELNDNNFGSHTSTGLHFIVFYAPWCGHCKRLMPDWTELGKSNQEAGESADSVKIGKVDCTANQKTCSEFGVRGYPTLLWFKDGENVQKYQQGRDLESLKNFVKKMTNTEGDESEAEESDDDTLPSVQVQDGVYELNDNNFGSHTSTGLHFIVFYAPWCGHCKRLMPDWTELGKSNQEAGESADSVKIGKVDCTANQKTCSEFGVRGYPTLLWFKDGKNVQKYQSARNLKSLQNFITTMTSPEKEEEEQVEEKKAPVPPVVNKEEDEEPSGPVLELKESNFDFHKALDVTFVKFYAPWCGFCKRLAPTWEELAVEDFSDLDEEVKIAKIDCTKYAGVCEEYRVQGYPTLILFKDGEKIAQYSGNRSKEDLKSFIIDQVSKESTELVKEEL